MAKCEGHRYDDVDSDYCKYCKLDYLEVWCRTCGEEMCETCSKNHCCCDDDPGVD